MELSEQQGRSKRERRSLQQERTLASRKSSRSRYPLRLEEKEEFSRRINGARPLTRATLADRRCASLT